MSLQWDGNKVVEADGDDTNGKAEQQPQSQELSKRERQQLSMLLKVAIDPFEKVVLPSKLKDDIIGVVSTMGLALITDDTSFLGRLFKLVSELSDDPAFQEAYQAEIRRTAVVNLGGGASVEELMASLGL